MVDKKTKMLIIRITEQDYQRIVVLQNKYNLKTLSETVRQILKVLEGQENLLYKSLKMNLKCITEK